MYHLQVGIEQKEITLPMRLKRLIMEIDLFLRGRC